MGGEAAYDGKLKEEPVGREDPTCCSARGVGNASGSTPSGAGGYDEWLEWLEWPEGAEGCCPCA